MSSEFAREHLKISLAKILQTLGCHTINTTPLEILTDILQNYLSHLSKITNDYANEFGFTDPNFDHLGLAFREMGISLSELQEYVKYVNFGVIATPVCKFPVPKADQLNFLKPGSKEVVTRPVHIHEHLPPMNPILTGTVVEKANSVTAAEDEVEIISDEKEIFKKPPEIPTMEFKKLKRDEEGSRPTREISSVMMTTSGFLSPAREGKLPESKTPIPPPPIEPSPTTAPVADPPSCTEQAAEVMHVRKPQKLIKKVEKKKEKFGKELFKVDSEDKVKRSHSKDSAKVKQLKTLSGTSPLLSNLPQGLDVLKLPPIPHVNKMNSMKFNSKALQAARLKTEKLNTTITPLPMRTIPTSNSPGNCHSQINAVDKLLNVPDKKKINILKKISNVKEKIEEKIFIRKEDNKDDPVSPPELVIDEPEDMIPKLTQLRGDITIEPINPPIHESSIKAESMFFEDSSPGTPSTPKTPELICAPAPIIIKDRKRRKPKVRKPKSEDPPHLFGSYNETDAVVERPKTPKAELDLISQQQPSAPSTPDFSFGNINAYNLATGRPNIHFLANFGGPGLIPPPLGNPLNPLSNPLFPNPFPLLNLPDFGQHPYLPQNLQSLPNPLANFLPKMEEMPSSSSAILEPVSLPPPRTPEPVATSSVKLEKCDKKSKEHKKDKKDKLKKKAKKEKLKAKADKKEEKKKIKKKEKREKRKEKETKEDGSSAVPKLTLKLKSPSPRPVTPDTTTKKLNIKPVVKKVPELEEQDSEISSLAKISALVTGPPKPKNVPPTVVPAFNTNYPNHYTIAKKKHKFESKPIPKIKVEIKKEPVLELPPAPSKYVDAEGNEVWICPGCSRQDDGSPMIGCDGCDAWYHWVCVGIQVPPDDNEDWYCRHCLVKKDEDLQSDKKKKRKRKEKKEHQ